MNAASVWTADTPRWLFLLMLSVVLAAYLAVGLLTLWGRRARSRATARESRSGRTRVLWAASWRAHREEVTS